MKTLIIGDLHLDNKIPGALEAQIDSVMDIIIHHGSNVDRIVFLGDVFMMRRPKPSVLLGFKKLLSKIDSLYSFENSRIEVFILRGNHDSENKNDDGVTALSLFNTSKVDLNIITQAESCEGISFIPHYEDEEKIREALNECKKDWTCFGHFGYFGSLNSAGDNDFSLVLSDFKCRTYLGHIHTYKTEGNITVVGTPYTTCFSEAGKDSVIILERDGEPEVIPVTSGPRHLVMKLDDVEGNLDFINDPNYFTYLRILVNTTDEDKKEISGVISLLKIPYYEFKFVPVIYDIKELSDYDPSTPVFSVTPDLLEEYINHSETLLGKEQLMAGLKTIHENQQDRNS